jgi:hypothetical protein
VPRGWWEFVHSLALAATFFETLYFYFVKLKGRVIFPWVGRLLAGTVRSARERAATSFFETAGDGVRGGGGAPRWDERYRFWR